MKSVPPRVAFEHKALWGENSYPERPWWRLRRTSGWTRCDGTKGPDVLNDGDLSPEITDRLGSIDRQSPLPVPNPYPGQVWTWVEHDPVGMMHAGDQAQVVAVLRGRAVLIIDNGTAPCMSMPSQWPPRGAILTAGPSCYGMNVPWSAP